MPELGIFITHVQCEKQFWLWVYSLCKNWVTNPVENSFTSSELFSACLSIQFCCDHSQVRIPLRGVILILCFFVLSALHDFPNIYRYMFTVSLTEIFPTSPMCHLHGRELSRPHFLHITSLFSSPPAGRSSKCAPPVTITECRLLVYKSRDIDTLRMMYECSRSSEEHGQLWLVPGDSCVYMLLLMSACWEIAAQLNQTLLL